MKQLFGIFGFWLVLATSCDPCADCGEPLAYDPTVKMKFINQDSAEILSAIRAFNIDSLDSARSLVIFQNNQISDLEDSIVGLDTLIENGQSELISVRESVIFNLESLESEVTVLSENIDYLDSVNSALTQIITVINNGTVQLQQVTIQENNSEVFFEDSSTLFSLPLLLENDLTQSTFEITIAGVVYTVSFSYNTFESIGTERIARVKAGNLDTIFHTFDSLFINCSSSECISDEATITAYF